MITAMVTPALLILGSASLIASALVRMARVVDRARILTATVYAGTSDHFGACGGFLAAERWSSDRDTLRDGIKSSGLTVFLNAWLSPLGCE
jgi:hypothetical protein